MTGTENDWYHESRGKIRVVGLTDTSVQFLPVSDDQSTGDDTLTTHTVTE